MKELQSLVFTKMSGAGNTFILLDARPQSPWKNIEKKFAKSRSEFAKQICSPITGVAADGLLFIEAGSSGFDYDWDFYNSDGSTAEMCGNAARCAARFCQEILESTEKEQIKFKTGAGLVVTQILEGHQVKVQMPQAKFLQKEISLRTKSSSEEKFALVNTGVPHLVQELHDIHDAPSLKDLARESRHHHDLKPAGANVTFYSISSKEEIQAVTFERGVEDYTLACGTGAVAAALVYSEKSGVQKVNVQMPGGELLVQFESNSVHPLMTGEAIFIGEFKYNLEVIK